MASTLIVLYNGLDQTNLDWVNTYVPTGSGIPVVNWYGDDLFSYLGSPPSVFPSILMTVNSTAYPSPQAVGLLVQPPDWDTVVNVASSNPNDEYLTSITLWGDYQFGQLLPPVLQFQNAVFLDTTLSLGAQVFLPAIFPLLTANVRNVPALQAYWLRLQASGQVNAGDITTIEGYASIYNIPLTS